jgi:SPASM domain peptide maturase of grasp-with-spasm system
MTSNEGRPAYFILFACCLPVRGATRSVLCDVQRGTVIPISHALHEVLVDCRRRPVAEVLASYGADDAQIVRQNLAALEQRELGFWCDDPSEFPDMDLSWDRPATITNAVIELSPTTAQQFPRIVAQLDALGCEALELRSYRPFPMTVLADMLRETTASRLSSVELLLCHSSETTEAALRALRDEHARIAQIVIHSAPEDRRVSHGGTTLLCQVEAVRSSDHCGFVHPRYFAVNVETFTESQGCNTCLNRKIAVDGEGNIRNCPAMPASYGQVGRVALLDVASREDFRTWWSVRKDQISVCRDCEFRHVCTDCRALLSDPSDPLSKPRRCGYDPYTARWSEEAVEAVPSRS